MSPSSRYRREAKKPLLEGSPVVVDRRTLTFPVEVRRASSWVAQFLVPLRRIPLPAGLRLAHVLPGRAMMTLIFVRYEDTDLDAYNEFAVGFLTRYHAWWGIYIHRMLVDQQFTLDAGRQIWGFPKTRTSIEIAETGDGARCALPTDGVTLSVRRGGFVTKARSLPTYTALDGVIRRIEWDTPGVRARTKFFGGATIELASGSLADELRSLGLPKRSFASVSMPEFRARFGPAQAVTR